MARRAEQQEFYAVAKRFVEEALERDGSLFTPGETIWSAENIEDLYDRFVLKPDESSDTFEVKLRRQLEGAPLETRQLAAEILYVNLLFPSNIGGNKKRQLIHGVIDETNISVPGDLERALERGRASFGPALQHRPWQLTMLLEFLREWKTMPGSADVLHDPWKFKETVFSVPHEKAGVQREALLHLVHPDTFERSVSDSHKKRIAEHFSHLVSGDVQDVDRQILQIREVLAPKYGDEFDFYDEEVRGLWLDGDEVAAWTRPLGRPPGLEAELQRILAAGASDETREILGAIFRRAILLHQETGEEGYLGAHLHDPRSFSVMKGNVWACGGSRALNLLIDDDPLARETYKTSPCARTSGELIWVVVDRHPGPLKELLADEEVWDAYGRMLVKFDAYPRARPNHLNAGKMSVLTGERLGRGDELTDLVSRFREEEGYPTERDEEHIAAREEFAGYVSKDALMSPNWTDFRRIFNAGLYGGTGPQSKLNAYISGADEEALDRLRHCVEHLLYSEESPERRLDDVLEGAYGVPGLGESVATKLLAVTYPQRFLPVFVTGGDKGKVALMRHQSLNLEPPEGLSRGEVAVRTNDLLRERLGPHFGDDTFAMSRFLYWLRWRDDDADGEDGPEPLEDSLAQLSDALLLDEAFLQEIVGLLHEKGQVIFYGPPGTGKTFVARALAKHLAADLSRREVVQFHPSYSYEDFVQGYRPVKREDGSLAYDLKHGPMMRLAYAATDTPGIDHVLLIDEINRGNLPKILGELLYLLEYRDDEVALMYGEDGERFSLPKNLLMIGTMNTADRSIALVDAALRRRFHFVPFFPEDYPLDGLLSRWLERHKPDMIGVAGILTRLNARLRERFGPHLQVGPSYFMREDLSEDVLESVWAHDITPFLEDQLFGHEEELASFTLEGLRGEGSADDRVEGASAEPGAFDA